jgi:hypothetical protein
MPRPRARDLGIRTGLGPPGPHNAITDVAGVAVGEHLPWTLPVAAEAWDGMLDRYGRGAARNPNAGSRV